MQNVGQNTIQVPVSKITLSELNGVYKIDTRDSEYGGSAQGATAGKHEYTFTANRNVLDVSGQTSPITIVAGGKVTVNGVEVEKSATGAVWDASFYSQQAFDPNVQDFAVSWLIESTTGTIREMGGLDNDPTVSDSFQSIEFAAFQVNNYFYSRIYESGAAIVIPNYATFYFQVGDRCGVKCIDGKVTYFVLRGNVEHEIYTSTKTASAPLYFKAALNRGSDQSGHSKVGSVEWHSETIINSKTIKISGGAEDVVSDAHIKELASLGMIVQDGSIYSDIRYTRNEASKFTDNGTPFPIDITHAYSGPLGQGSATQSFG